MASGKMSCFFGLVSFGTEKLMRSPPVIKVAVVAMSPFTVIYFFFMAFLSADFVATASKIPTPYSCNRWGLSRLGTVWVSLGLMYCEAFGDGQLYVLQLRFADIAVGGSFFIQIVQFLFFAD
nr:hypothetical protein [Allomuricauda sp.]